MTAPIEHGPEVGVDGVRPVRVQLRRTKGWRMPENTVSVARPGKWGNPFRIGAHGTPDAASAVAAYRQHMAEMIEDHGDWWLNELTGKNLACFCKLDAPCHADVLLELANPTPPTKERSDAQS